MTRLTIQDIEDIEASLRAFTVQELKMEIVPRLIAELKRLKTEFGRLSHLMRNEAE